MHEEKKGKPRLSNSAIANKDTFSKFTTQIFMCNIGGFSVIPRRTSTFPNTMRGKHDELPKLKRKPGLYKNEEVWNKIIRYSYEYSCSWEYGKLNCFNN